jgi:creatinine amidohydrolase
LNLQIFIRGPPNRDAVIVHPLVIELEEQRRHVGYSWGLSSARQMPVRESQQEDEMTRREIVLILATACLAASVSRLVAQGDGTPASLSQGGYSIFDETMVDMTFPEVEEAAKKNTIVLWPMGVIEEHGPHLPLGSDIYGSYIQFKQVARLLKAEGKSVIIAPPMYWGINVSTVGFGGTFSVRPATLKALIEDTFMNFRKDGFRTVYIVTGHGSAPHNQAIVEGVEAARATTGVRGFVLLGADMLRRVGLTGKEPHVVALGTTPPSSGVPPQTAAPPAASSQFLDVHAGAGETSSIWHFFPQLVKTATIPTLAPTRYGQADFAEWQKGWEDGRRKTPLGYFGDPASASPTRGAQAFAASSRRTADTISRHFESQPWSR